MNRHLAKSLCFLLVLMLAPRWAAAQDPVQTFEFRPPASAGDAATAGLMRDLAVRILPVYQERDTERYLSNLAALQMVAGEYAAAHDTRLSLRERRGGNAARFMDRSLFYDLYARARAMEAVDRTAFAQSYTRSFQELIPRLDDGEAYAVIALLETPPYVSYNALQHAFDRWRNQERLALPAALDLVWKYLDLEAHRSFAPLVAGLAAEDDGRRYQVDDSVVIKTAYDANIHAVVVRPKNITTPLPTLLKFTIYDAENDAADSAAHGYAGVVAYTRGKKRASRARIVPLQHDGEDARAVIAWIARQEWSDGRVGMYGSGYSGFAAWAAARRPPPALKAIATSSPMAPGVDFPMSGHVFRSSAYRWLQFHTRAQSPQSDDDAQWRALNQAWYESGKRYRDLDRRFGKPNRIFRRWLNHPSYDRFWQKMIPFRKEFAKIDLPVLTTAGYYGGDAGALHYFSEHHRYNPDADHTLLVGPYDDGAIQHGPQPVLRGHALDSAALIDLRTLRFQWFDHVFRSGAKPPLLRDRVNYQVMGANEWRHASSLDAMANESLKYFLQAADTGDRHLLAREQAPRTGFVAQTVQLADRSDAGEALPTDILGKNLPVQDAVIYASEPLSQPIEFSGLLSGKLDFTLNKMDVDLNVALYELRPDGAYLQLFDPYEFRASYARDRVHRRLLKAGVRQQLPFTVERLMSRKLQAGSRVVLVLGVNKRPDREINYGVGKDVSEESVRDARKPLSIRWYGGSYIDIPVRR